jgi:hypothetical protein
MIIGSIVWPEFTAKAETIELALSPDTSWQSVVAASDEWSDYGKAEARFSAGDSLTSMKAIADVGYKTLKITYEVESFTAASGAEVAGVMPFASYGSAWSSNDQWINLTESGTYSASLDLSAISTTSTDSVTFGIQIANLEEGSTVKFRITSAKLVGTSNSSSGGSSESGNSDSSSLEEIGDTSSSVTATVSSVDSKASDGYYETALTINNSSSTYIADWIAVAEVSVAISGVKDYSEWSELLGTYSDGKLYIYPNKSAAVSAGSSVSYSKIGYTAAANSTVIKSVTVYYSSQENAFSSFKSGLTSSAGGAGDSTTTINTDVDYNYAKLLQESLYFYDANMCGTDVSEKSELSWRSDCHTEDAKATYNGKTVDVSGGYHDAGDHAKFGLPQAYAATCLGLAHMQFADAFTSTGTESHYKRIMDRFVDYFERCTVLGDDGQVEAFCYQVGNGNNDHSYWGAPENQSSRAGEVYFTSSSDPCTDIVTETAAALAAYYLNYKDSTALSYSEKLFAYADSNTRANSAGPASSFYSSDSWDDDYALAAALLYKATGNSTYKTKYNNVYGSKTNPNWVLSWNNVAPAALLYSPASAGKSAFLENQSGIISSSKTKSNDNNYLLVDEWGSARYNTAHQLTGLLYDNMYSTNSYSDWAKGQMQYILGNNAGSHCFVVGYNKYSSKYPHHRAASGYGNVTGNGTTTQAHVLVGALVGGPRSTSSSYVDTAEDYVMNEVALDYNATLVGAAAGLYSYVMKSGTEDEQASQKTVPNSEVSSELRTISGSSSSTTEATTTEDATTQKPTETTTATTITTTEAATTQKPVETTTATTITTTEDITTQKSTETTTATTVTTTEDITTQKPTESTTKTTTATTNSSSDTSSQEGNGEGNGDGNVETGDVNVTNIKFDKSSMSLTKGESGVITATVLPENASVKSLYWTSSDNSVVSVDPNNGTMTALSAGDAIITAKAMDGSGVNAKCEVTVIEDAYTIDVSRITSANCAYVKALVNEKGDSTVNVTVTGDEITVTLLDSTAAYTITGENDKAQINAENIESITLENATISKLNISSSANKSVTLSVNGSNKITDGIKFTSASGSGSLVITKVSDDKDTSGNNSQGSGNTGNTEYGTPSLTVTSESSVALDVQGSLRIENTALTVTSTGNDAVKVTDKLDIESGTVTLTANKAGIVAGGDVTVAGGELSINSTSVALTAKNIEVSGGSLTASSSNIASGQSVITAENSIKLTGGSVSASAGAGSDATSFGVESEDGSIVMSENVVVEGNPTYSKSPVNTEGEVIGKDDINKDDNKNDADKDDTNKDDNKNDNGKDDNKNDTGKDNTSKDDNKNDTSKDDTSKDDNKNDIGKVDTGNTVAKKAISSCKVTMATKVVYTGKALKPTVKLVMGKTALTLNKDFKVTYSNNKNFGKAKVVITGIGNYTGTVVKYFNIVTSKGKVYQSGNFKYKITNPALTGKGTVTLSSVVKKTSAVSIPATVKIGGKVFKVTAVGASAFKGNKTLKTVTIGKNVTTIGSNAFYKCKKLSSVTIPATVTKIGAKAFYGCTALKTLVIKSSKLTSKNVGKNAFTGTAKKLTVKVPAKKLKAYKTLLKARGVSSKAVIKK